jgi:16S rRNA (cytosine967-C5)-methyltransferase
LYISQQLAAEAVEQVLAGRNLAQCLEQIFAKHAQISLQQRAVAQDLSYGTLRFLGEIEALVNQLLDKPLSIERVRCLLLVAVYQLQHAHAAPHTVVDQAVSAAAHFKKPWVKGLVNAVLRNFLRQHTQLCANIAQNEVAQYSYPRWWIAQLKQQYPQKWQEMLHAGNQHPPLTLRVNQKLTTQAEYVALLQQSEIEAQSLGAGAISVHKPVSVDKLPGFRQGLVSVQDLGAQLAATYLDLLPEQRVLDACCAPGGKTGHILEQAPVRLLALDSDGKRLQRTADNLARLQLNAELKVGDAAQQDWWDGEPFARILADVPCTASGIVRRHVDIKWLRRQADIASFAKQQAAILSNLWQLLAKDGKLLYVTCSVFQQENQQQISQFLARQSDAVQLPLPALDALENNNIQSAAGQLIPNALHDGFFYALLQKK